jgi:hypothetical protein
MIVLFLFILLLLLIIYSKMNDYGVENFATYTRCKKKKIKNLKKEIFEEYDIDYEEDSNKNWDIYLPCGYGNVENELKKIKVLSNNQIIFGINGCDKITSKNSLWLLIHNYYGRNVAKTIMPESYILSDKKDMELFKKQFYPKKVYVIKKNIQRKMGIKLSNNLNEIMNVDDKFKVVQEFLTDTYIINKRVLNLRIYLLIKCKNNNVTFYIHKLGKCLYSAKDLNSNKLDFESRITNSYATEKNIYDNNPLTLEELKIYLNNKKEGSGKLLFNNINELFKKLCLAIKDHIYNSNNLINNLTLQMFGVDVIFDNNMKPFILEINKGPDMVPKDDKDRKIKYKVELDILELFNVIEINDVKYSNGYKYLSLN